MRRPAEVTGTTAHDPAPRPEPSGRQSRARPEQERTAARSSFRRTPHHSGIIDTSNFRIGPIKSFVSGIYDGLHATPRESDSGPIFLGIKNVTPQGRLDLSAVRHIAEKDYGKWTTRVVPQEDDIVFSYEATLHRYAIVPADFKCCLGRRMALIRSDRTKALPRFLYYYFLTPAWRAVMESHMVSGATVDRIPLAKFPDFEVCLPDLNVQHRMASILSAYDDLIENNRRRIRLLEQAARMLYEEWFVRLRFPGHEGLTVTNGVPDGWKTEPLSVLCNEVRESVDPKTLPPDSAYIGLEHMPRRSITLNEWTSSEGVESTKLAFREGDVLFGKIRPYFHKVGFALTDGIASSDAIVVRPADPDDYEYLLLLLSSDRFVSLASKTVREGSKMPRADWRFLSASDVLVPELSVLNAFRQVLRPVLDQLRNLALTSRRLAAARDLLLPRLMNGETAP